MKFYVCYMFFQLLLADNSVAEIHAGTKATTETPPELSDLTTLQFLYIQVRVR